MTKLLNISFVKISLILSLLSFLGIAGCCDNLSQQSVILRDTLYLTQHDTVTIYGKADVTFRSDTIIVTKPFFAGKDTIVRRVYLDRIKYDTISFRYAFPENTFDLKIKRDLDTLKQINTEIKTTFQKEPTFWDKLESFIWYLLIFLGGIVVGVIYNEIRQRVIEYEIKSSK
jgi:hypothetical protein